MPISPNKPWLALLLVCLLPLAGTLAVFGQAGSSPGSVPPRDPFPGVDPIPGSKIPLSAPPLVLALKHLDADEMAPDAVAVVSDLRGELAQKASLAGFDITGPGWSYQQIDCPAFPDYVFLTFSHGAEPNGSSRFVAALSRSDSWVRIVSTYSHGFLPFESAWTKPATYEIFNHMLRRERGLAPIGYAQNWLVIGMCYAEMSGNHVQVLTAKPLPNTTLDLVRLDANLPQLQIESDQSAEITFSDASKPATTSDWLLHFNRKGEITSVTHAGERQHPNVALKP